MENKFLDIRGVAKVLGIHQVTAYKYIASGKIKSFRLGNRYRVQESDLQAYLDSIKN